MRRRGQRFRSERAALGGAVARNHHDVGGQDRTAAQSSGAKAEFEAQALNFTFSAKVDSGRNAGLALKGTLELKGERENDGVSEVEGRFFPDEAPSVPSLDEVKAQFEEKRKALRLALRTDIKALSTELQAAMSSGAVRGSDGPSAAQKEALATFKAKFIQRMAEYREATSALIAEFRAAKRGGKSSGDDDDNAARGFEVRGTIDANGATILKVNLGDNGTVFATAQRPPMAASVAP